MLTLSGDARSALFSPLPDDSGRGESVSRRLGSAIALGLISDGERLPPEPDLAASLNVSTMTLREALSDLRDRGLVETRRGRFGGSFVHVSPAALDRLSLDRLAETSVSQLREIGDMHVMLAGASARLAADRASPTEIARLRDLIDRMKAAGDEADVRRLDGRFFVELAAAAQSVRMTTLEIELQAEVAQFPLSDPGSEARAEVVKGRRALVSAVARGNGTRARTLAEEQVGRHAVHLIESKLALTRRNRGPRA